MTGADSREPERPDAGIRGDGTHGDGTHGDGVWREQPQGRAGGDRPAAVGATGYSYGSSGGESRSARTENAPDPRREEDPEGGRVDRPQGTLFDGAPFEGAPFGGPHTARDPQHRGEQNPQFSRHQPYPGYSQHPHGGGPQFSAPHSPQPGAQQFGGPQRPQQPAPSGTAQNLMDGEWHRMHPLTPIMRGGAFLVVVLIWAFSQFRERVTQFFLPDDVSKYSDKDELTRLIETGAIGFVLLGIIVVLLLLIGAFYLSWRFSRFRVTTDRVEVQTGVLSRHNRQARLDRIQGISVQRPFLARIFGLASLRLESVGSEGAVPLAFLRSAQADALRAGILARAAGVREAEATAAQQPGPDAPSAAQPGARGVVAERLREFTTPELAPEEAQRASVVRIPLGRLIGSVLLSDTTVFVMCYLAIGIGGTAIAGAFLPTEGKVGISVFLVTALLPMIFGAISTYFKHVARSAQFSVSATEHGVRIGYGLMSLTNETLPVGRIHAVAVRQPLLWRMCGWWQIKLTTAVSASNSGEGKSGKQSILLPVGTEQDVLRVLSLVMPLDGSEVGPVVRAGMYSTGAQTPLFVPSPRSAMVLRPVGWKRAGMHIGDAVFAVRRGLLWRSVSIVPAARVQSYGLAQGPVQRMLGLATLHPHTVTGVVDTRLTIVGARGAERLFADGTGLIDRAVERESERETAGHQAKSVLQ